MVSCSNVVVSIGLDTLDCIIGVKAKLVEDLFIHNVIHGHYLFPRKKSNRLLVFELLVPRMSSDFIYAIPVLRIDLENFRNEMAAIGRKEFGNFKIARKNFLVKV